MLLKQLLFMDSSIDRTIDNFLSLVSLSPVVYKQISAPGN